MDSIALDVHQHSDLERSRLCGSEHVEVQIWLAGRIGRQCSPAGPVAVTFPVVADVEESCLALVLVSVVQGR